MIRIFASVFVFASALQARAAGLRPGDLTPTFAKLANARAKPNLQALRAVRVILVPGFMNEGLRRSSGTYADQVATLKSLGADYVSLSAAEGYVGIASLRSGAEAVAAAIRRRPKQVLLMSQSKGSLSALEALLAHPELRARVAGWFSVQGAFGGSPVADGVEASSDRDAIRWILQKLGGDPNAVHELTRVVRGGRLQSARGEIAALARQIPIVSYASWAEPNTWPWAFQKLASRWCPSVCARIATDGVVETEDEFLPGTPYVLVHGVNHGDTTMTNSNFNRVTFTNAALALMLGR